MKTLVIVLVIFSYINAFSQQLGYMRSFNKIDEDSYFITINSEEEAVKKHQEILDMNGIDTTFTSYQWGDNPLVFSYFKLDPNSDEVVITFIFPHKGKYDIWFMEIYDEDTYFIDVLDRNGETVQLKYIKPLK